MTIKEIWMFFCSLFFSTLYIYFFIKKIKYIRQIQMRRGDKIIKGNIVENKIFLLTGDVHPIVSCDINGSERIYKYRYFYNEKKFPIGKEINLSISQISGLPYDKKDLIKDMVFYLFFSVFCILSLVVELYVFLFLR